MSNFLFKVRVNNSIRGIKKYQYKHYFDVHESYNLINSLYSPIYYFVWIWSILLVIIIILHTLNKR